MELRAVWNKMEQLERLSISQASDIENLKKSISHLQQQLNQQFCSSFNRHESGRKIISPTCSSTIPILNDNQLNQPSLETNGNIYQSAITFQPYPINSFSNQLTSFPCDGLPQRPDFIHQSGIYSNNISMPDVPHSSNHAATTSSSHWSGTSTNQNENIRPCETTGCNNGSMQILNHPCNNRPTMNLRQYIEGQQREPSSITRSKSDLEAMPRLQPIAGQNDSSGSQNQRSLSTSSYVDNNQLATTSDRARESSNVVAMKSQQDFVDLRSMNNISQDWLDTICRHLIEHMDRFGICVIDNFLGSVKGNLILKEVERLYSGGQYTHGRLVSDKLNSSAEAVPIRSDRVIWIDGCEDDCTEINNLIQTFCSVITNSSRLSLYNNNGLDKIVINKRTKAHVACYPGNGTRYIKHVDNPNGDGRVITSIYYLNKDWNSERDGGLLRMFPAGIEEIANIEPLFDRVLFFWSDRRNPHEVLPAYRDRFAITVWFIGENQS